MVSSFVKKMSVLKATDLGAVKMKAGEKESKFIQSLIIGEEVVCTDGLGRVEAVRDDFPFQWVQVKTYIKNRSCKWSPLNVRRYK